MADGTSVGGPTTTTSAPSFLSPWRTTKMSTPIAVLAEAPDDPPGERLAPRANTHHGNARAAGQVRPDGLIETVQGAAGLCGVQFPGHVARRPLLRLPLTHPNRAGSRPQGTSTR
jgi:hypothetical protein